MRDRLYLEENLKLLSNKEFYYCSIDKKAFFNQVYDERVKTTNYESERVNIQTVVLFVNEQRIENILEAEKNSDPYFGKKDGKAEGVFMLPIYLYYDEEQFIRFVQCNNIRSLCKKFRVVILVGMEEFEKYFCQLDVIFPSIYFGDVDNKIQDKIKEIILEKQKIYNVMLREIYLYYENNKEKIKKRIVDGIAKICILKNYFEPFRFKIGYRQLKEALEKKGYLVEICDERGSIFRTNEIINIYRHKPDIIFQINKSRDGRTYQGEPIYYLESLDNLVFINWIQDFHPAVVDPDYAFGLRKRDYIFSCIDENLLSQYGYSNQNVIYRGIIPANNTEFFIHSITNEEHKQYDCDLGFFGTIFDERFASAYIYQELMLFFNEEQIERICDVLFDILGGLYNMRTQKYVVGFDILTQWADRLQEELGCDDVAKMHICRIFCVIRYNSFRKLILKQLAAQKKYKIILYGPNDVKIDGIDYGGHITEREELSKAMQCCKIFLSINPDATMCQRVAEGLLSHTVGMINKIEDGIDVGNIEYYLHEYEGFCYFSSKAELIEKCDLLLQNKEVREKIAEAGYQKAVKFLTPDYVFSFLMEELKEKVKNNF